MRALRMMAAVTGLVLALGIAAPSSAGAWPVATYHGTWSQAVAHGACADQSSDVTGAWNATLKADGTAEVDLVMFKARGQLHAAWGGNSIKATWVQQPVAGRGFSLLAVDAFGMPGGRDSFVLDADGVLTYTITPYCPWDLTPATVTGVLVH